MRFHWLIIALLVVATGCRLQPQTPAVVRSPPTTSPTPKASTSAVTPSSNQHSSDVRPSSSLTPIARSTTSAAEAILTTDDTNAQVNLRSSPSVTSKLLGYGRVGDRVQILKQAASVDGDRYIWYQVRFPRSRTIGWIREDFVRLRTSQIPSEPPAPSQPRTLKP
jgi:hypothetical protein